jgi:hypothetical protein
MVNLAKMKSIFATLLVTTAFTPVAEANLYNLADFNLTFNGASYLVATLETSQAGIFNTETAIEDFLNSSTYSAILSNGINQILDLNNSNSVWDLVFSFEPNDQTTFASLVADSNAITLTFDTPMEVTEARLFLRNSSFGYISYFQANNVTDYSFFDAQLDPTTNAFSSVNYGSSFVMPAITPVAEPSNVVLFLSGLAALSFFAHRRQS